MPERDSGVAGAAEAWQISQADLVGMTSFREDEEMYERARELRDRVHRDGFRQGLQEGLVVGWEKGWERGLEEGRIRGRALSVRRFATRKFGSEAAERLTVILQDGADADRIAEVLNAIVDCDSEPELFARVRA